MNYPLVFLLAASSFLTGIFVVSIGFPFLQLLIWSIIFVIGLQYSKVEVRTAFICGLFLLIGGFYYKWDDDNYRTLVRVLPENIQEQGMIINDPKESSDSQIFYLQTDLGKIQIKTGLYPQYFYGDILKVSGIVQKPKNDSFGLYLAKERVVGAVNHSLINVISRDNDNVLLAYLFKIKRTTYAAYSLFLSADQAGLLYGIMSGANEKIPIGLANDLSQSGARYLTAIDGLHMAIFIFLLSTVFSWFFSRGYALVVTFIFITLFIAMTGFTVSAVRSFIMAFISLLALRTGRLYAPENALLLAALILTLQNPKIIAYDAGFQLSFLAVIGIIYLMPALKYLFKFDEASRFRKIQEIFLITISVQLMTAPIVITQFQNFSLTAFLVSIFVVPIIPAVISLGFALAILSFFWQSIAWLIALILAPILDYLILVISLSAKFGLSFNPNLGFVEIAIYYLILVVLIWQYHSLEAVDKLTK